MTEMEKEKKDKADMAQAIREDGAGESEDLRETVPRAGLENEELKSMVEKKDEKLEEAAKVDSEKPQFFTGVLDPKDPTSLVSL